MCVFFFRMSFDIILINLYIILLWCFLILIVIYIYIYIYIYMCVCVCDFSGILRLSRIFKINFFIYCVKFI